MKNILYYHLYLTDNPSIWTAIFFEQMKYVQDSSLLSSLDEIRIFAVTQDDLRNKYLLDLCRTYNVNFSINLIKNSFSNDYEAIKDFTSNSMPNRISTENFTLAKIYENSQTENMRVCYIHSKGVTSGMRLDKNSINQHKNYFNWRHYLNWGILENWKKCVKALEEYDVVGVNFNSNPMSHYSGNFWWANSAYIKNLPNPSKLDWWIDAQTKTNDEWLKHAPPRFRDEQWICYSSNVKALNLHSPSANPANSDFSRDKYSE